MIRLPNGCIIEHGVSAALSVIEHWKSGLDTLLWPLGIKAIIRGGIGMTGIEGNAREVTSILHDQWRNTNSLIEAQTYILNYLGDDPFSSIDVFNDDIIGEVFRRPVQDLEKALNRMIEGVGSDVAARRIPISSWKTIQDQLEELNSSKVTGSAVLPFHLRDIAVRIRNEIALLKSQDPRPGLNKDQTNQVLFAAGEIERLDCIFNLHRVLEMTKATNKRAYSVLQTNFGGPPKSDQTEVHDIDEIVEETCNYFRNQATLRGIKLEIRQYSRGAAVRVGKADLLKALGNLLDNAIKYTGELSPNSTYKNTWVEIRIMRGSKAVSIRIESWGIPITDEENLGGFIFKYGYRGWFVRKTGVEGTGTGLADVKDFAILNGGDLSFDSSPVRKAARIPNYTTTTVTLTLPLAQA